MAEVLKFADQSVSGPVNSSASGGVEKARFEAATKIFGEGAASRRVTALDEVDLTIADGEFFTLLGPSGCGKTTLLRLLAGFEVPTSGSVYLDGRRVDDMPPNKRPVNTVFQSYALFPHLSVARNIAFSLEMLGWTNTDIDSTVARMLDLVRLDDVGERMPAQLSGGQQQRVALARALASGPSLLLLDEPLSALDLRLRRQMQGELKRIQYDTGTTFIYVTHDQEEALAMSDRIAVMNAGRIHQIGTPRQIYDQPADLTVCKFIGDINLIDAQWVSQRGGRIEVKLPNGRKVPARCVESLSKDAALVFAFRPEHVELKKTGRGLFSANIVEVNYAGAQTVVHLQSEFGSSLVAHLKDAGALTPGAKVFVHVAADKPCVLEA